MRSSECLSYFVIKYITRQMERSVQSGKKIELNDMRNKKGRRCDVSGVFDWMFEAIQNE